MSLVYYFFGTRCSSHIVCMFFFRFANYFKLQNTATEYCINCNSGIYDGLVLDHCSNIQWIVFVYGLFGNRLYIAKLADLLPSWNRKSKHVVIVINNTKELAYNMAWSWVYHVLQSINQSINQSVSLLPNSALWLILIHLSVKHSDELREKQTLIEALDPTIIHCHKRL